ncbi:MAG: cytochrome c biogenesis protein [Alicyclobacillus macrosporangiidus]|uniref:cytochrome C assembly family protein n=1 Tax=Alicyclobacillus macrosporangiidus TaxID=392015 RepID=UPI0026EE843A|nr:cytochrome c biogenesis protein CcsA [Alicyclobacillus macrosporangiidus]MCL6598549.1 cytochrome c biogenesis protein [Alicyclobacillus macrosporangiidus]
MLTGRILYDTFVALYALSVVLFFLDAVHPRRALNRTALGMLFASFVLETVFFLDRLQALGTVPVLTSFDALSLVAWLILAVTLVLDAFFRVDLVLFVANLTGFGMAAFAVFRPMGAVYTAPEGDLLYLHIGFALLSYTAFAFAFVFSLMYLVEHRLLRAKRWNRWHFRSPPLDKLDRLAYRSIVLGLPLLLVAMVLGTIWGKLTVGRFVYLDPKLFSTTVLWGMYGISLLLRARSGWSGPRLVGYNLLCFTAVIANLLVVGSFSLFHHV